MIGGLVEMKLSERKFTGIAFLSVLLISLICASGEADPSGDIPSGEEGESVEEIVMSLERGAMERWQRGDPMGWAEISADEITYIDPGLTKPIEGLTEYVKYLKQFEGKIKYQISEFIEPKVERYGDLAVLTYNYRSGETDGTGSLVSQTLWNTTEVYCLFDNEWKIIHTHWSFVDQKPPDSTEVPVPVEQLKQKSGDVPAELMAIEAAAMERWRKGDPWGFTDICAPEVTYFDTGTVKRLDGLEVLKAEYAKREGKIHYDVMEFIDPKVQVHGNSAVLMYRFFSTRIDPGGSIAGRTPWNCTEVFCKRDGKWYIVHTHWSFINGERK